MPLDGASLRESPPALGDAPNFALKLDEVLPVAVHDFLACARDVWVLCQRVV
jgi:hypothetical protein